MNKHLVIVRREWSNPAIYIDVTDQELKVAMALSEFLESLVEEAGNPTFLITKAGMLEQLNGAADRVVRKMKSETARVM